MSTSAIDLITKIQQTWPSWFVPVLQSDNTALPKHELASEVFALLGGRAASLPYFSKSDTIGWVTIAPDSESLRSILTDIRAWIIPSLGWEEAGRATVVTNPFSEQAKQILSISPSGYIRWRSRSDEKTVLEIVGRLRKARALAESIPLAAQTPVPTLAELRQRFATALAANDRQSAEDSLKIINRFQLDTAQNAALSRLRMLDHFGDDRLVVEMPELDQLLRVRLPQNAQTAILQAFYRHLVEPQERLGNVGKAQEVFAVQIAHRLGVFLEKLHPERSLGERRLLAYHLATGESAEHREILNDYLDDPIIALLVHSIPERPVPVTLSNDEQFFVAWRAGDWTEVQRIGLLLIPERSEIIPVLERSLAKIPNVPLRDILEGLQSSAKTTPTGPRLPQTWAEWFAAIPTEELNQLEQFLNARISTGLQAITPEEGREITERLTAHLIDPSANLDSGRRAVLFQGLAELAGLCMRTRDFPAVGFVELYRAIANCWGEWKRGSASPPDGQVFLELAAGLLQISVEEEEWLADQIVRWWTVRPVRALLPFMVGAVELFHRLAGSTSAERFWIEVGIFAKTNNAKLTQGEKLLWRRVGADIGWDGGTLDEYVPLPKTPTEVEATDPLKTVSLHKIAIVSMREEQANRAAEQLEERSGATVVVVSDKAAGPETDLALTADVIAFVWSATTHAVFRAFDMIDRKKIAYVQGTGATNIVLAVERWVAENFD